MPWCYSTSVSSTMPREGRINSMRADKKINVAVVMTREVSWFSVKWKIGANNAFDEIHAGFETCPHPG